MCLKMVYIDSGPFFLFSLAAMFHWIVFFLHRSMIFFIWFFLSALFRLSRCLHRSKATAACVCIGSYTLHKKYIHEIKWIQLNLFACCYFSFGNSVNVRQFLHKKWLRYFLFVIQDRRLGIRVLYSCHRWNAKRFELCTPIVHLKWCFSWQ